MRNPNPLPPNTTYPIICKMIPTQYTFLVSSDGTMQVRPVTKFTDRKFKSEQEARDFINNVKEII